MRTKRRQARHRIAGVIGSILLSMLMPAVATTTAGATPATPGPEPSLADATTTEQIFDGQ